MISRKRTRSPIGLAGLILGLCLISATPAFAAVDDEVSMAHSVVSEAMVKLDAETVPDTRLYWLREAVDAIAVLEGLGGETAGIDEARIALADLAAQAITPDVLRLSLIDALANLLDKGDAGLQRDLEAKAIVQFLHDPAYRSTAWSTLAAGHLRVGETEEAERLATLAIEEARSIPRDATRDGALRAAILTFPATTLPETLLELATNSVALARTRAELYQKSALSRLSEEGIAKASQRALSDSAYRAFQDGNLARALVFSQALDRDEEVRSELLKNLIEAALEDGNDTLALRAAKSMSRDRDQDRALRLIVDARIDRDKALRAREIVPLFLKDKARIDADIAIAKDLDRQGYKDASRQILLQNVNQPIDDPNAVANLVAALASLSEFQSAAKLAEQLADGEARSHAYSRLIKALADVGKLDEAERLLGEISEREDLGFARAGIAKALIKADRITEGEAFLVDIDAGPDHDRVVEALSSHALKTGDVDKARLFLSKAQSEAARCRILISIALVSERESRDEASALLEEAVKVIAGASDSDESLADIAVAFARIGNVLRADALVSSIEDAKARQQAKREIAEVLVKQGALAPEDPRLEGLNGLDAGRIIGELALATYEVDGDVEGFVKTVAKLPWQVRIPAFRHVAEERARKLDLRGWLSDPDVDPLSASVTTAGEEAGDSQSVDQSADFSLAGHRIQAPARPTRELSQVRMPDIFELDAEKMRARMPAPADPVGHLAILGFSPFSLEAFKLGDGGEVAVHQVQISQQMTWPRYIAVEKGVVTLGSLLRDLPEATTRRLLIAEKDDLLIRVPIIVLPGATLLMSGAEFNQYRLGAQSGAFIAVAGRLIVQDTEIVGWDEVEDELAFATEANGNRFRPFITAWGGSDLQLAASRLAMLGYDSSKAFGLTQSSGAAVQSLYAVKENRPTGNLIDNSFENLRYGYYSYEVDDVRIVGNEYRDNIIYGIDPHDRSRRLLIALNTAYGSQKKHGIIISREVDDSFIVGNLSLHNKGSGIMLDRTSIRNIVYANTAVANEGDGLTFYESGCNIAAANDLSRNLRAGVKIRNSTDVGMYDNQMEGNGASGADIYVSDLRQSPEGQTRNFELDPFQAVVTAVLSGNAFTDNGDAINAAGAAQLLLEDNQFLRQSNRIYGGDLKQLSPFLLRLGDTAAILTREHCEAEAAIKACDLGGWPHPPRTSPVCTGQLIRQPAAQTAGSAHDG
jgi:poly(beta-D-mannuronate) C5 epimerase